MGGGEGRSVEELELGEFANDHATCELAMPLAVVLPASRV